MTKPKTVEAYTHPPYNPDTQEPVIDPTRIFYVTARMDGRHAFLLGPFETHQAALDSVDEGRSIAMDYTGGPHKHFAAYGTCSLPRDTEQPETLAQRVAESR